MKKQKGITLIALVITIIVMLILAGVAISLVIGDNGVLNQAQNAENSTDLGAAKEQVSLAWTGCETDYLAEGIGKDKSTYFTASELTSNLSQGEITEVSFGVNDAGDSELSYKVTENGVDTYYKMQVTAAGIVSVVGEPTATAPILTPPLVEEKEGTLASQIDKSNYGDYVNYNVDLGLTLNLEGESEIPKTDWRIFYEDTEQDRVYLIAADYVPNTSTLLKASAAGMTPNGDYSLYWSSPPSELSKVARQDSIFGINASSYTLNESNANSKCVSTLLDTDHWSNFVDSTFADYAIGGPTIEMYTNSWNANYGEIIPTSESTATGYEVNGENSADMSSDEGYGDNLYYTHKTRDGIGSEECIGYWLASPNARGEEDIMLVRSGGRVHRHEYSNIVVSVRPVVSLRSGITATKDAETGIWELGEN